MTEKPLAEHEWLQKLVGDWAFEGEANMGPDQPSQTSTGTETVRSLDGMWTIAEGLVNGPDGGMRMIITLGYDPARKSYVGTFIASCMTRLWTYEGTLDAAQRVLTLNAEGPDFSGSGTARYHDIIEVINDDERTLSSEVLMPDGSWHRFMTTRYRRARG